MAKIGELEGAFYEWVKTRPECIQKLIERLPPDRLYRLKPTNQRVTIYSWSEDGTVTVNVTGEYNCIVFGRQVFGINPDDLEECDLPLPGEHLGEMLTDEKEIKLFIELIRPGIVKNKLDGPLRAGYGTSEPPQES